MSRTGSGSIVLLALACLGADPPLLEDAVRPAVGSLPSDLSLDPFYKKYTDALGIPVVSSEKVPDQVLLVARDIVIHMLAKRPDVREAMVARKLRVAVMAQSESTTDLPEQRDWKKPGPNDRRLTQRERDNYEQGIGKMTDKEYWAEGTQTWFWSNYEYVDGDRRVQTPDDLKTYDPRLYALLERVYLDHHIPADIYHGKNLKPGGAGLPGKRPGARADFAGVPKLTSFQTPSPDPESNPEVWNLSDTCGMLDTAFRGSGLEF